MEWRFLENVDVADSFVLESIYNLFKIITRSVEYTNLTKI